LRDTYWDTPDGRLARAGCTLRVREQRLAGAAAGAASDHGGAVQEGDQAAELTLKGPAGGVDGAVWSRTELSVTAPAGSGPPEWARLPAARPILEALERLGALEGLRPDVVLRNPRREIVLERNGNQAVLSLDEVAVEGAPYRRRYVEVELTRGSPADLDPLVEALLAGHALRPSRRGKVQAAREWLARRRAVRA
jgi:inorganic triphosphatase YgiF